MRLINFVSFGCTPHLSGKTFHIRHAAELLPKVRHAAAELLPKESRRTLWHSDVDRGLYMQDWRCAVDSWRSYIMLLSNFCSPVRQLKSIASQTLLRCWKMKSIGS